MIRRLPIALFTSVMGSAGLAVALRMFSQAGLLSPLFGALWTFVCVAWFAFLLVLALSRLLLYGSLVRIDWCDPGRMVFFPAVSISFLLLSSAVLTSIPALSFWLWVIGASMHALLSIAFVHVWLYTTRCAVTHVSPIWFLIATGNALVPVAGSMFAPPFICWYFWSVGILLWVILVTVVFYRLSFHDPLVVPLTPTLFIFSAPPAAACLSYLALTGSSGSIAVAYLLYYSALFFLIVQLSAGFRLLRVPFTLAWWSISFPLAAITNATFALFGRTGIIFFLYGAVVFCCALAILVAYLAVRTFWLFCDNFFSKG